MLRLDQYNIRTCVRACVRACVRIFGCLFVCSRVIYNYQVDYVLKRCGLNQFRTYGAELCRRARWLWGWLVKFEMLRVVGIL